MNWTNLCRAAAPLLLAACTAEPKLTGPVIPPDIPATGFARAAFLAAVDVPTGRITFTTPSVGTSGSGANFSLVGGDAVLLTASNFSASPVGAFQPGKVRVSFDIAITNRLDNVQLVGPSSFPAPPPGTAGPLLFPFDVAVAVTSGGAGSGAGGVVIVLPSLGLVAPSTDWDGDPWNFFNDSTCAGANDCFRWEEFTPIAPGGTAASQRVGFDLDPTVGQFTARLILAADLADLAFPPTGGIQGSLSTTTPGPLAGITVTVAPGGASAVSDPAGAFALAGVPAGTVALSLSGVPPSCTTQPSYLVSVLPGQVTTINLVIPCAPPQLLGTVSGSVQASIGGPIQGASVTVIPSGLPAEPPVTSDATGTYTVAAVDVSDGTGTLNVGGLPAGCVDPGTIPYSGLVSGGSVTLNVVVVCP